MGAKKVSVGDLKHQVTIENRALVDDGVGGQEEVWSTYATVWAKVEPISARQKWFAEKLELNVTHLITIRFLPGLTVTQRIVFNSATGTRTFHIHGFRYIDEESMWVELQAEEGTPT